MVRLHTYAPPCTRNTTDTPRAHSLAVYQATRGAVVVNGHHENVQLEPVERAVLQLCDGRRRRSEVVFVAVEQLGRGDIVALDAADFPRDPQALTERVEKALMNLSRDALLQ